MLSNLFTFIKAKGSSLSLPPPSLKLRRTGAHGWVGARATYNLAPAVGFEPTTKGLTVPCATAALRRNS